MTNWDARFLSLAAHVAMWSKDPSTKVGAVVVDDLRRVVGTGYNGFPRGVLDMEDRYADREKKYPRVVHAEVNAILNAVASVRGCTLYVTPLPTCERCAGVIIQSGIRRVVVPNLIVMDRWSASWEIALEMYQEAGVMVSMVNT